MKMALHLPDSFPGPTAVHAVHAVYALFMSASDSSVHFIQTYALPYYDDFFGSLWSIWVHFGAHHG